MEHANYVGIQDYLFCGYPKPSDIVPKFTCYYMSARAGPAGPKLML